MQVFHQQMSHYYLTYLFSIKNSETEIIKKYNHFCQFDRFISIQYITLITKLIENRSQVKQITVTCCHRANHGWCNQILINLTVTSTH